MPAEEGTAPVALVTGATRGLGRLVAERLVARRYVVVTGSTGDRPPGVGEALHLRTDVTDPAAVDRLVRAAQERSGRVDVLVNNAGFANPVGSIPDTSDATATRCFATNVLGPYYLLRRVLPGMASAPSGGVVINVASRAGLTPIPGLAAYSASKTALVALTLAAAKEHPDGRVLCVSVCPGGMDTEMRASVYGREDARGQLDPRPVADLVVEIATQRTISTRPVPSGAAVLITRDGGTRIVDWATDERGHASFGPRSEANR